MRRKYEITITTTLSSPKGEGRDRGGGKEGDGKKGRMWSDWKRRKERERNGKIMEREEKRQAEHQGEQNKGGPITFADSTRLALACIALPLGKSFA